MKGTRKSNPPSTTRGRSSLGLSSASKDSKSFSSLSSNGRSALSSLSSLSLASSASFTPSAASSPLHTSQRSITQKGHLTKVVMDRHKAVQGLRLGDIKPKNIFGTTPSKENKYTFPQSKRPANLYHRVLSYVDQFETPVPPKQIVHHFTEHPTSRIPRKRVYAQMNDLLKSRAMYKSVRVDEEGTQHYFYGTTRRSRLRHANRVEKLMKLHKPLALDEVVWQNLDELDFGKRD